MREIYLGIDPGTAVTGYGVIAADGSSVRALDYGCIRSPTKLPLPDRYLIIFESVTDLISRFQPKVLIVETQYIQKNVQSAMKLGMARGVIVVAARKNGVEVVELTPSQAKKAVVGNGNASKEQIQGMTKRLLNLSEIPKPEDAADALALALACVNRRNTKCMHLSAAS